MKNILKTTLSILTLTALLSSCIKEVEPTDRATEEQVTLEAMIKGIPAALVMANSLGYAESGNAWDFSLPAIHIATESMTGDLVITGDTGYDWFNQWGANNALGSNYAAIVLTWDNYYTWIMTANDIIGLIDGSTDLSSTDRAYLGSAYAYRAMFYLDLVRLYEFKENKYTEGSDVIGLGVPIVLETTTEAEAKNNPRAKVDDIYDKVIFPDLDKAEELLADYSAPNKYAISLALVYGLQARAYLERGTAKNDAAAYTKAAEYARKAISASGCTILTQRLRRIVDLVRVPCGPRHQQVALQQYPVQRLPETLVARSRPQFLRLQELPGGRCLALLQNPEGLCQHQVPSGPGQLRRLQGGRSRRPLLHACRGDVLHRG